MDMLDEGTTTRTALQISDELARLGADPERGIATSTPRPCPLSALKSKLDPSLDLFADVILNPSFPAGRFRAPARSSSSPASSEEKAEPDSAWPCASSRACSTARATPTATRSPARATRARSPKITRDDLVKFHQTWFKPNNATLVVVGDTTLAEIKPKLETLFGLEAGRRAARRTSPRSQQPAKARVYLIDRPGSLQSVIIAGQARAAEGEPRTRSPSRP